MSLPFTIRVLRWDDAAPLARPVREEVFVVEQGVPLEMEWDEHDALCRHAVAQDGAGRPIGTARLLAEGRIGRMAVRKAWRRKGVGAALMRALLDEARRSGMTTNSCAVPSERPHAASHSQTRSPTRLASTLSPTESIAPAPS